MTHLLTILFLLLACVAQGAGLGPYNPAQHAVNGFMPTQVPGLQLWLDASKLSWMTNGQSVEVWRDWSGKSNAATNGTASKQPIIGTINGRKSVKFDGVDDWLVIKDYVAQLTVSFFCIMQINSNQIVINAEHSEDVNTNSAGAYYFYSTFLSPWNATRQGTNYFCNGFTNWFGNSPALASHFYDTNGSYAKNGIVLPNGATTGNQLKNNSAHTNVLNIFARKQGFYGNIFGSGQMCEMVIFTNRITSQQELMVQRCLGTKYGIVVK